MEPESLVAIAGKGLRVGCGCATLHGAGGVPPLTSLPALPCLPGLMEVKESDDPGAQLVLAGDPRQLGPVLRSPLAQKHGLGYSLLERLLTYNALYKKGPDGYNPQFITKLLRNYRYPVPSPLLPPPPSRLCGPRGGSICRPVAPTLGSKKAVTHVTPHACSLAV